MMSQIINAAQKDDSIKVILLHGGKYYSSGNDLKALMKGGSNPEDMAKDGAIGIFENMNPYLNALNDSVKPVVGVVRGGAIGIGFTQLAMFDFLYVSPDAHFMTPFMKTCQSPEAASTLNFPKIFGSRLANEILLMDKVITAEEALKVGFVNGIIPELAKEPEFFDIAKVPAIGKLLATDFRTLINCKTLIN